MKIGVISDTHIAGSGLHPKKLASRLINQVSADAEGLVSLVRPHFAGVDLIIHAGDFVCREVIAALEQLAPVEGVAGNMDPPEIAARFPARHTVQAAGFNIGIVHGYGPPNGLEQKLRREFNGLDCIVFGHTHIPFVGQVDGVLMFNPGSPTDKRFAANHSIGILHLEDKIRVELIPLP